MSTSLKRTNFFALCLPVNDDDDRELIIIIVVIAQIVACHLSVISRHGFHVGHTKCGSESLRRLLSLTTTKTTKTNCTILCTSRAHPVYTSEHIMQDLHCKALVDTALVQTADTVAVVARTRGRAEENVPDWCNLLLLGHGPLQA